MTLLCYCVQIDLPVQLEIEMFIILAFMLVKQDVALSRFHVCFHVFLRSFVPFHVLLWESPLLLYDITGEAVLEHGAVWCWFCVTAFTKSLIRLDCLSQLMLRRGSSGPASWSSLRELESDEIGEARESFCALAHCFKQSDLDPAHRRLFESACPCGAEPRPAQLLLQGTWSLVIWYLIQHEDIHRSLIYVVIIHYDAKV